MMNTTITVFKVTLDLIGKSGYFFGLKNKELKNNGFQFGLGMTKQG